MLHQLSTFPDWKKPHSGLRKMFMGEVVGKRVVVQSLWIGGWCGGNELARMIGQSANGSRASTNGDHWTTASAGVTKAPWGK